MKIAALSALAVFGCLALVSGCASSTRVAGSETTTMKCSGEKACAEGKTCSKAEACCNSKSAEAKAAGTCSEAKAGCSESKAGCTAAPKQN